MSMSVPKLPPGRLWLPPNATDITTFAQGTVTTGNSLTVLNRTPDANVDLWFMEAGGGVNIPGNNILLRVQLGGTTVFAIYVGQGNGGEHTHPWPQRFRGDGASAFLVTVENASGATKDIRAHVHAWEETVA